MKHLVEFQKGAKKYVILVLALSLMGAIGISIYSIPNYLSNRFDKTDTLQSSNITKLVKTCYFFHPISVPDLIIINFKSY